MNLKKQLNQFWSHFVANAKNLYQQLITPSYDRWKIAISVLCSLLLIIFGVSLSLTSFTEDLKTTNVSFVVFGNLINNLILISPFISLILLKKYRKYFLLYFFVSCLFFYISIFFLVFATTTLITIF